MDAKYQLPEGLEAQLTMSVEVHETLGPVPGGKEFGYVITRAFARLLETGKLKSHPFEVVPGGLDAVQIILDSLKAGKNSALKYVFRVGETRGI